MPSPQVEAQIDRYIKLSGLTGEEAKSTRSDLMDEADYAEAGDASAKALLRRYGIILERVPSTPVPQPAYPLPPTGTQEFAMAPRWPEPTGAEGEPLPPQLPGGTYWYTEPATGKMLLVDPGDELRPPRILDEISPGAGAPSLTKPSLIPEYEEALGRPLTDYERSRFLLGFAPSEPEPLSPSWQGTQMRNLSKLRADAAARGNWDLVDEIDQRMEDLAMGRGVGVGGMSEYQAGQLAIQQERLGLDRLGRQIEAARTAQPLTYLSLLRGAPPGETGEIYQGLRRSVPSLRVPEGVSAEGGGWQAPPMPPFMSTIQAGEPLRPAGLPSGRLSLRPPGVQAQAAMSPYERGTLTEAAEFTGIPSMDWEDYQRRLRRGIGTGVATPRYGGTPSFRR